MRPAVKPIRRDPGCAMTLRLSLVVIYAKERWLKSRCVRARERNARNQRKVVQGQERVRVKVGKLYPLQTRLKNFG